MENVKENNWHYLSDFIFWDSERINQFYGEKFKISPRKINGYSNCWQASSSDLKLEYFDLIRMMITGHSKIESYLSRDIRFERIDKTKAEAMLKTYSEKAWDLNGFSNFMGINTETLIHGLELMRKSRKLKYLPKLSKKRENYLCPTTSTYMLKKSALQHRGLND